MPRTPGGGPVASLPLLALGQLKRQPIVARVGEAPLTHVLTACLGTLRTMGAALGRAQRHWQAWLT